MKFFFFLTMLFLGTSIQAQSLIQKAKADKEPIYEITDQPATYPGGDAELLKFMTANMRYPTSAKADKVEGRVILNMVVEKDGKITIVKPVSSPHDACTEESVRLLHKMPNWNPAMKDGQAVRSYYIFPIQFKLDK
jgi:periplasmic protein TonB